MRSMHGWAAGWRLSWSSFSGLRQPSGEVSVAKTLEEEPRTSPKAGKQEVFYNAGKMVVAEMFDKTTKAIPKTQTISPLMGRMRSMMGMNSR